MPVDLKSIKERLAKATPGPWERDRTEVQGPKELHLCELRRWEDAALIAHAPADLPALVSEVESLRALLREVGYESALVEGYSVRRCRVCLAFAEESEVRASLAPHAIGHKPDCRLASAIREET